MTTFTYFAYGSNMLTARLRERCRSATPLGTAYARGYSLACNKRGKDGSGKATLLAANTGSVVSGVLFRIHLNDRLRLDRAEGEYRRHDAFNVYTNPHGQALNVTTYIAPPESCQHGLRPFDWYIALILAGLSEHGIGEYATSVVSEFQPVVDEDTERAQEMFRLMAHRGKRWKYKQ